MRLLKAADLFCGAGGTSSGAENAGARVVCAVNHWQTAVETHSRNFPHALHINSRVDQANPSECPAVDLLFASPECTHHSRARGGRPTSDQQRSGAWDIMRWVEWHRPSYVVVENVREWLDWGPVGDNGRPLKSKRGHFFSAWVKAVEAAGYRVDHRILNAADFGAATSRERLFVVARKGNRYPVFPEPTHGRRAGGELPGMGLQRWRCAAEVIDWTIPCRSVFSRTKPLADKTLARIEAGLRRFVGPFVATLRSTTGPAGTGGTTRGLQSPLGAITANGRHHGVAVPYVVEQRFENRGRDPFSEPIGTLTTGGNHAIALPFQFQGIGLGAGRSRDAGEPIPTIIAARENHGVAVPYMVPFFGENAGQRPRSHSIDEAMPAVTSHGAGGVAVPFIAQWDQQSGTRGFAAAGEPLGTVVTKANRGVAVPFLADVNHGDARHANGRTQGVDGPLGTVTSSRGKAVCVPFLVNYFGEGSGRTGRAIDRPMPTITTRDRCGLVYATVELAGSIEPRSEGERRLVATMRELGVADIGFRMLSNPELAAAQGFPASYWFAGCKADVTKQIGNSVSPPVAEAITRAIA